MLHIFRFLMKTINMFLHVSVYGMYLFNLFFKSAWYLPSYWWSSLMLCTLIHTLNLISVYRIHTHEVFSLPLWSYAIEVSFCVFSSLSHLIVTLVFSNSIPFIEVIADWIVSLICLVVSLKYFVLSTADLTPWCVTKSAPWFLIAYKYGWLGIFKLWLFNKKPFSSCNLDKVNSWTPWAPSWNIG